MQRPAPLPTRVAGPTAVRVPAPAPASTAARPPAMNAGAASRATPAPATLSPLAGVPTAARRAVMREAAGIADRTSRMPASMAVPHSREGELVRFNTQEVTSHRTRAQIFSLIVVAERLEQAWVDNKIAAEEYEARCTDLIAKFNAAKRAFPSDIGKFAEEYRVSPKHGYTLGYSRLVVVGLPGTREKNVLTAEDQKRQAKYAAACTAGFITLLDAIALGHRTPEALLAIAQELHTNLGRIEGLQSDFAFRNQLGDWTRKMYAMNALTSMSEDEVTALKLQVELGYGSFQGHFE